MDKYLPAVEQMNDLTNMVHMLIIAIGGGVVTMIGVAIAQFKIFWPRTLKRRDEQRRIELEAMRQEFDNKAAAKAVDVERDRMLPKLVESTIGMAQSISQTMTQNVQQTATYIAQLSAHDKQLTANTDRLEELAQTVDTAITNIQLLKTAVDASTDQSKSAAAFGNQAATAATETLEIVKREINKLVSTSKGDTGELPPIAPPAPTTTVNTGTPAQSEKAADANPLEDVA